MTHEHKIRFLAIQRWANHAIAHRTDWLVAAEAIEGLAARIRAEHSPQTGVRSTTLGAENESGRATHHTPPAMAEPRQEVRRA